MAVMPTAVEAAWRAALPGHAGPLLDRQRIHVGAQAQGALAVARAQYADDAGPPDPLMHLDPGGTKGLRHSRSGAMFGKAQLGVRMEVAAQRDKRGEQIR